MGNHFGEWKYLLGRSLGPPNDGFDISSDNQCFQGCPCRLTDIAMQRRTSPKNQIYGQMFSSGIRHALAGKLFAVFKPANRTWRLTKGTSKKSNNGNRQCQIKLNDWRLHKAAQIYRTCNWKEMQNERDLARFGHTRLAIIAAARFPIGRRTMPIVNEQNTCSKNSV